MTRRWLRRIGVLALVAVAGQVGFTILDFDPDPARWALMATAGVTVSWLALDIAGVGSPPWDDPLSPYARPDAGDDSVFHRVLTNHLADSDPGPTLHRLLVELARLRDPDLVDPDVRAFAAAPEVRLTAPAIDRYLTRIEEPRDHT